MASTTDIMQLARQRYMARLPFARRYRPGKFTAHGVPREGRDTVCVVRGAGVLRRLWTTHSEGDRVWIDLYIDDGAEPVLSGRADKIARAASRITCAELPWGGFLDGKSVSLYLPFRFERSLRLEAELLGDVRDGPYWQVDYALGDEEPCGKVRQGGGGDDPILTWEPLGLPEAARGGEERVRVDEFALRGCTPHTLHLDGPGVIRRLTLRGEALDKLWLRAAFDVEPDDEDVLRGPFQVDAPLQRLVGPFSNAGVERLGAQMDIHFPMPFRRRADLQLLATLDEGEFHDEYRVKAEVVWEEDPAGLDEMAYFNAAFTTAMTNGRDDFEVCSIRGAGHFVGVHLFDTAHDHGGGDNLMLDAPLDSAAQLHGICAEDYFHHAYMRVGVLAPHAGCPTHSARYRHHLEMPVPFQDSFVFNWGMFASQAPQAVAFWYQRQVAVDDERSQLVWQVTGPFPLDQIDALGPDRALPDTAMPWPGHEMPRRVWRKRAQQGFVDLCHVHRRYIWPVAPSTGGIPADLCNCLETAVHTDRPIPVDLVIGCDDPIRVFLNGRSVFTDDGRQHADPFAVFRVNATLTEGLNRIMVIVGNTVNTNWRWNGFSLVIEPEGPIETGEIRYLT